MPDPPVDSSSTIDRPQVPPASGRGASELRGGAVLAGRFTLLEELGAGGVGRVFAARDRELGGSVAVKVLRPELTDDASLERLRREVRAARTPHPALVRVFDLHHHGGLHFLSMELVEGESLRDRLRRGGPLDVEATVEIGRQVAAALAHLHGLGVVHRDVKPGNVLLASSGEVKLCDLGLARPLDVGFTLTATELVVGTPAYMAPEQASGDVVTPATDVYALGLTLAEALTGKVPLADSAPLATLDRRRRERPPRLRRSRPECPPWLDRLLRATLEPRPGDRPDAATVAEALERRRMAPLPSRRDLRRAVAALIAVVAAAAAVAGGLALVRPQPVRLDVASGEVRGLDRDGAVLWRRAFEGVVTGSVRADLDGDGVEELAVATRPRLEVMARGPGRPPSQVLVFDRTGRQVTAIRVEEHLVVWSQEYGREVAPLLAALDLDGDGRPELVVVANHESFFPSAVLVYRPETDRWRQVLYNSGQITAVAAAPADGRARLRLAGANNRLGFVTVVAELELKADDQFLPEVSSTVIGSPDQAYQPESALARWRFYTPMVADGHGSRTSPWSLRVLPDGGTLLVDSWGERRLDRLGNPVPGPTEGMDLGRARLELLGRAAEAYRRSWQPEAAGVVGEFARLREGAGPLLREPGTRLGFELFEARSLARAGELRAAIARLEDLFAVVPSEDAVYRLAHLEAVAGRAARAVARLEPVSRNPVTPRGEYDVPQLLLRLAIASRDRGIAAVAIARLASGPGRTEEAAGLTRALWARAQLWWDEATVADEAVSSWTYEPAGDAIGALARWRRGRARPEDIAAMRSSLEANPEAGAEVRIALAAARLAAGDAELAAGELQALAQELAPQARDDFERRMSLDLARALKVVALAASGEDARARAEAEALRPELIPGLLPAILVDETLAGRR